MKTIKSFTISLLILLFLTSCSSVFSGGFTGKLMEDKGGLDDSSNTPLVGATVFIYTDEGLRNNDYNRAITDGTKPSNATSTTTTNDNGQFSVSKIIWKTNSPAFGKTADKINLYLIVYKSGFGINGFNKNSNSISITSDSTNESSYTESFKRTEKVTTINFQLANVAANGEAINDTLQVKLSDLLPTDCTISKTSSSNTFSVAYKNDDLVKPKIEINNYTIQSENKESTWVICDEDGKTFSRREKNIKTATDNQTINLYAKQTEFSFPTISGRLKATNETPATGDIGTIIDDDVVVKLCYIESFDGGYEKYILLGQTTTTTERISNNGVKHGVFSITPDSTYKWKNKDYDGKYAQFPTDSTATNGKPELYLMIGGDIIRITDYTSQQTSISLGEVETTP